MIILSCIKWLSHRSLLLMTTSSLLFNNVKCLSINANVCYIWKVCIFSLFVSFLQSQLFCWLLELWCFILQTCHTLLLLVFQVFNRLRNFSCWSLNEVIYCDHSKVLLYNTVVLLHFIAASLADGCTQKSFFAITAEVWTRIWNYIWNRACVFCYCTQVCHLCYYLSMSTLSVVQLFLLECVLPNLTTIK